jgi:hypothetical protein
LSYPRNTANEFRTFSPVSIKQRKNQEKEELKQRIALKMEVVFLSERNRATGRHTPEVINLQLLLGSSDVFIL